MVSYALPSIENVTYLFVWLAQVCSLCGISDGRESKSCFGHVFNSKLGYVGRYCMVSACIAYSIFSS
jgi:hypothetical protein